MIPTDALRWIRIAFDRCDRRLSTLLSTVPYTHEPMLDQTFIAELASIPPSCVLPSQTTVLIDTHFLGGRAMFYNWEVADIGMLVTIRFRGEFRFSKVVLLQSKRLYPRQVATQDDLDLQFRVGFGRLLASDQAHQGRVTPHKHIFDKDSRYLATTAKSNQMSVIRAYQAQRRTPVYFMLYNPVTAPLEIVLPTVAPDPHPENITLGTRVVPWGPIEEWNEAAANGTSPSLHDIREAITQAGMTDPNGWKLSDFIVDHVLACREGRVLRRNDGEDFYKLFYQRSAPIQAAIAVTIDVSNPEYADGLMLPEPDH